MLHSFKELIVVLAVALLVFRVGKPIARQFTSETDFSRRRNVWLVLTAIAFLSPTFWLFAAVAIPVLIWARRRDSNPVALYLLLLHVIPPVPIAIPAIGINQLFDVDNYRLLSFCVLIPVALRLRRNDDASRIMGLQSVDVLLLAFGVLQIALFIPPDLPNHIILHDSLTNIVRRALLFLVDVYALYFVVSRSCSNRDTIADAMAAFCLGCAVMALLASFESARHWLLYADLYTRWMGSSGGEYLERAGLVRAEVTAGRSLALGYLLAIAFGFWLYLQMKLDGVWLRVVVALLLWVGMFAAYSRGPWLGAVTIYLVFMGIGPGRLTRAIKGAAVVAAAFAAVSLSPFGDRISKALPFLGGSVDNANVTYRQALIARSWELIWEHPFFGDQLAILKMEDLRQGQGIIDLVNTYIEVALSYGLIGLFFFVGFLLINLTRAYRTVSQTTASNPDVARLGGSLVACIVGTMLMLGDSSFGLGYEKMFYVLAGLAAAYAHMSQVRATSGARME